MRSVVDLNVFMRHISVINHMEQFLLEKLTVARLIQKFSFDVYEVGIFCVVLNENTWCHILGDRNINVS